jgi:hypothetical protein
MHWLPSPKGQPWLTRFYVDKRVPGTENADPRTTMRYDRARVSLDRHATYVVAAFLAGAAR